MSFLDYCLHVLFIENLESLWISKAEDLLTEELHTEGMNRTDEVACVLSANETVDSVAHLGCSLICKGQA